MFPCPAYADPVDNSGSGTVLVLWAVGAITAAAGLAFVPVGLAWARRHRGADAVVALAVLWGLVTAVSVVYATMNQMQWSKEKLLRINSGYYDPNDNAGAPTPPWTLWACLGGVYVGLVAWSVSRKKNAVPAKDRGEAGASE